MGHVQRSRGAKHRQVLGAQEWDSLPTIHLLLSHNPLVAVPGSTLSLSQNPPLPCSESTWSLIEEPTSPRSQNPPHPIAEPTFTMTPEPRIHFSALSQKPPLPGPRIYLALSQNPSLLWFRIHIYCGPESTSATS